MIHPQPEAGKATSLSSGLAIGLERHFAACAAIAALGAVVLPGQVAQAAIIHSGELNLPLTTYESFVGSQVALDITGLSGSVSMFNHPPGSDLYFYLFPNGFTLASISGTDFVGPSYGFIGRLDAGTEISSSSPFATGGYLTVGYNGGTYGYPTEWNGTHTNSFVGFSINLAGGTHYGWIRLDTVAGVLPIGPQVPNVGTATVVEFAYNSIAGAPILAGDTGPIPEPGGCALGLLALGAISRRPARARAAR